MAILLPDDVEGAQSSADSPIEPTREGDDAQAALELEEQLQERAHRPWWRRPSPWWYAYSQIYIR